MSVKPVRSVPAVLAPLQAFANDVKDLVSVPLAFFGGIFGTIVISAGLVLLFMLKPGDAQASEEDQFELDFEPGTLVKLGPKPEDLPEKIIVEELVAEETSETKETITKNEEPPPPKKEEKPKKKEPKPSKERPDPTASADAKKSDRNQKSNTPHKDLPTVDQLPGDPFGDVNGWSDLRKDGDPWATAVMAELNKLQYPTWAGQGGSGTYAFKMQICKDGTVKSVIKKGSTGDPKLDKAMQNEIERMKIPKPPANVASKMKSSCVFLKYSFKWSAKGVR